jgi:hypothetical protein
MLPLYQGIMCGPYDHRVSDVLRSPTAEKRQNQPRYLSDQEKADPSRFALPAYWVAETEVDERLPEGAGPALLGVRDITSSTNERTVVAGTLPVSGVGNTVPLAVPLQGRSDLLAAVLASFVLDFAARIKVGGTHLNFFIVNQFPVLSPRAMATSCGWWRSGTSTSWIRQRVLELTYTAWDMAPFARDLGDDGPPFIWDDERRFLLRAELDAASFHLYGIAREDVDYIMETFPIVKRKDIAAHGEYRTKHVILEMYDAMRAAIDTGVPYTSPIDPPPGNGPRHPESSRSMASPPLSPR